ncbi:conserved membrane protein of unknown function [Pseudomonas marincola]|uniref:DoxX protein n=1 Tax=Pseudomonas marincola TaxID=437900 RepID=A0A653E847_9PSED|nr:DoxX family protein [Pseudomonas marincola]CAE6902259.1 conserved membrane protein of unknown function [Pseudomonas marincola]
MKHWTLLLLRISLGWLLVIWGADKLFNVAHSVAVANKFYFGLLTAESAMQVLGVIQIAIGVLIVIGLLCRWTYPLQALLNGLTLLAVLGSVIDPWGWFLQGSNALFYPSLIIFAASLLLIAFRDDERWALDIKRAAAH